ncbi:MAG: hypothetical protein IJZ04_04435 [Clostridia bacterium]|nr:hypothetical protein [Clostridia bacterium]
METIHTKQRRKLVGGPHRLLRGVWNKFILREGGVHPPRYSGDICPRGLPRTVYKGVTCAWKTGFKIYT